MTEYIPDASSEPTPGARPPAIFLFQPHAFERVTPSRLVEWEQTMRRHFGLTAGDMSFDDQKVLNGGTWSNSGPPPDICADDCDNFADELDLEAYPPDSTELLEQTRRPAVFMLQPSSFTPIGNDRLGEWEQITREHVGLTSARLSQDGSGTLSATLPNECMDDSDYLSE
jgi:hypothetical protein